MNNERRYQPTATGVGPASLSLTYGGSSSANQAHQHVSQQQQQQQQQHHPHTQHHQQQQQQQQHHHHQHQHSSPHQLVHAQPLYQHHQQLMPPQQQQQQQQVPHHYGYHGSGNSSAGSNVNVLTPQENCICRLMGQEVCTCGASNSNLGLANRPTRSQTLGSTSSPYSSNNNNSNNNNSNNNNNNNNNNGNAGPTGGMPAAGMAVASPTMLQIHHASPHQQQHQQQQQHQYVNSRYYQAHDITPQQSAASMYAGIYANHTAASNANSNNNNNTTSSPSVVYGAPPLTPSSSSSSSRNISMPSTIIPSDGARSWSGSRSIAPPQQQQQQYFGWTGTQPETRAEHSSFAHTVMGNGGGGGGSSSSDAVLMRPGDRASSSSTSSSRSMATASGVAAPSGFLLEDEPQTPVSVAKYATEEGRWDAIHRRSHAADSHFVYGALTTRIYCRPSCASKRPDRARVQYFVFPDAAPKAECAGFRACKRCKPGTPGTADLCVLAVGECLRHMTRAALLGESDEVDKRLKRRTLKQYSSDYGVSAFHFHRTLKSVCTLTPGEYTKAAHSLVLQDELGFDRYNRALEPDELSRKLRGWSLRRSRRALGNVLPHAYVSGVPDLQTLFIVADQTAFGRVVVIHSLGQSTGASASKAASSVGYGAATTNAGEEASAPAVLAVLIGDDATQRAMVRFPRALPDEQRVAWLQRCVADLAAKGTREVQMPREVVPWVRRARLLLAAKQALEPQAHSLVRRGEDGFDEEEMSG